MKAILIACLALFVSGSVSAQKAKPNAKGPVKTKAKAKAAVVKDDNFTIPLLTKNEDGSSDFYDLKKGDKLVYHVKAGGREYDFIVTLNHYSFTGGIDFDYEMTSPADKTGHVTVTPGASEKSKKYHNYFSGGELNLTDAVTVWLSWINFSEMPGKKTQMSFDDGPEETMYRPEKDEVEPVVKIKGQDKKIEAFMINNKADGTGDKTLWINGISSNPLIVKMDLGWVIELKEIR